MNRLQTKAEPDAATSPAIASTLRNVVDSHLNSTLESNSDGEDGVSLSLSKSKGTPRKENNEGSSATTENKRETVSTCEDSKKDLHGNRLEVVLTKNAIPSMVVVAMKRLPKGHDDLCSSTNEDSDGNDDRVNASTTIPTTPTSFNVRLSNLQPQPTRSHIKEREVRDDADQVPHKMFHACISDGSQFCLGAIWQGETCQLEGLSNCILSVSGFVMGVASTVGTSCVQNGKSTNTGDDDENLETKGASTSIRPCRKHPFIYITRYEILQERRPEEGKDSTKDGVCDKQGMSVVTEETQYILEEAMINSQTSKLRAVEGLARVNWDIFTEEEQCKIMDQRRSDGDQCNPIPSNFIGAATKEDVLEVENFLEQHAAIMALKRRKEKASLLSSSSFSLVLGSLKYFQNYESALNEFDRIQRENQFNSLIDMTEESRVDGFVEGKETLVSNKEQGWVQNQETLDYALQCKDEKLSSELLQRWHAWLLGDGLEEDAGVFQSENVSEETKSFCEALEEYWVPKIREEPTSASQIAAFAAAAMLGVLEILPFKVGNHRVARILINWCLRRAGLPFCITLYSDQKEKMMYQSSIEKTKHNFFVCPWGYVDEAEVTRILEDRGGLTPLAGYILHRIALAAIDLCTLVEKKALLASEETDARLVRLAREKSAEGCCIICFDENPNIATLCCGKPVHFNCLAEWLSSNTSCPQCRSDLPSLSCSRGFQTTRENPIIGYGRDRFSMRTFPTDEFLFARSSSSSSSEDSSSTSSSSSSDNSAFVYSGLDYGIDNDNSVTSRARDDDIYSIQNLLPARSETPTDAPGYVIFNYVTTDEEDDDHDHTSANADDSHMDSYSSEADDDLIGRYPFHPNRLSSSTSSGQSSSSSVNYTTSFGLSDIVSHRSSTSSHGITNSNVESCEESTGGGSYFESDDEALFPESVPTSYQGDPDYFHPFRMSFLDPELMVDVQNVPNHRHDRVNGHGPHFTSRNEEMYHYRRGNDTSFAPEIPAFARPRLLLDANGDSRQALPLVSSIVEGSLTRAFVDMRCDIASPHNIRYFPGWGRYESSETADEEGSTTENENMPTMAFP